jgi:hypothetical protein
MDARNALQAFLDDREIKPAVFARQLNYDKGNFHRLLKPDGHKPSLELAVAIERATEGVVPATAWAES